jgi:glutaredoxin
MIKIYTIPDCKYCNELKVLLNTNNIQFIEVNVDLPENEVEYNKIHDITKSDMVPIVKVGKQLLVPNVSFKTISDCFLIIKKLLN